MRSSRSNLIHAHGFSLAELLVVIGIIGILAVVTLPVFVNVLQTQQARGAAQELVTLLNQARQLAITANGKYQVEIDIDNNRLRFVRTSGDAAPGCNPGNPANPVCIGPGTDAEGYRRLENQARLSSTNVNPTFNHLGTGDNGTIIVEDSRSSSSLNVVISSMGRIRICPPDCP